MSYMLEQKLPTIFRPHFHAVIVRAHFCTRGSSFSLTTSGTSECSMLLSYNNERLLSAVPYLDERLCLGLTVVTNAYVLVFLLDSA